MHLIKVLFIMYKWFSVNDSILAGLIHFWWQLLLYCLLSIVTDLCCTYVRRYSPYLITFSIVIANSIPGYNHQVIYHDILRPRKSCSYFASCSSKDTRISSLTIEYLSSYSDVNISPVWCNELISSIQW